MSAGGATATDQSLHALCAALGAHAVAGTTYEGANPSASASTSPNAANPYSFALPASSGSLTAYQAPAAGVAAAAAPAAISIFPSAAPSQPQPHSYTLAPAPASTPTPSFTSTSTPATACACHNVASQLSYAAYQLNERERHVAAREAEVKQYHAQSLQELDQMRRELSAAACNTWKDLQHQMVQFLATQERRPPPRPYYNNNNNNNYHHSHPRYDNNAAGGGGGGGNGAYRQYHDSSDGRFGRERDTRDTRSDARHQYAPRPSSGTYYDNNSIRLRGRDDDWNNASSSDVVFASSSGPSGSSSSNASIPNSATASDFPTGSSIRSQPPRTHVSAAAATATAPDSPPYRPASPTYCPTSPTRPAADKPHSSAAYSP